MKVKTLSTGKIKPGLGGTATFQRINTVYLGREYNKTEIPEYLIIIDGSKGKFENCQAGRDFEFEPI